MGWAGRSVSFLSKYESTRCFLDWCIVFLGSVPFAKGISTCKEGLLEPESPPPPPLQYLRRNKDNSTCLKLWRELNYRWRNLCVLLKACRQHHCFSICHTIKGKSRSTLQGQHLDNVLHRTCQDFLSLYNTVSSARGNHVVYAVDFMLCDVVHTMFQPFHSLSSCVLCSSLTYQVVWVTPRQQLTNLRAQTINPCTQTSKPTAYTTSHGSVISPQGSGTPYVW